ncbi:MAG: DinB family protein [Chloroflexi bacterium]|nr:DinB family protein [Chloroflexota bacterium]MCC6894570.1 DinB family protein [Anaerolineae bacterium]
MTSDKAALFAELDRAREELWQVVDAHDPQQEIYPGWNQRDFYAHIAGWEAYVYEVFLCNAQGIPLKTYSYNNLGDLDEANAHFVAERQTGTLDNIKLECEISRYAIKRMIGDIPAVDFEKPIQFPWGKMTPIRFIHDAIKHEDDHAADIRKLRQQPA